MSDVIKESRRIPGWVKTVATITATFVATFILTIALSEGMAAQLPQPAPVPITTDAPRSGDGIALASAPATETLDATVHSSPPGYVFLPMEDVTLPDPLANREAFLKAYLTSKHSVLANHVDALSEQTQWKLLIAISDAESNFCKKNVADNCWGIGGAWDMKHYDSYDDAIADVNRILEQHYVAAGMDTPSSMVDKWVGHDSPTWEAAVQQELDALKDVQ
jgi:hypothetical protein